ncbi:transketolase [Tundrisphaera sp. TA3]|uniref:transketolase n=1 Tax=Tundrisphaera sp. TA3 TaxID=3435775 RepID=UPI003EBB712D
MRDVFSRSMVAAAGRPEFVFLSGDLGFRALEPLRDALGDRFLNAGVAEQNMVSIAAGMAREGLRPWVYSIAPFLYARAYEQIRNDVCFHRLPVVIVGNGGGYGYGVMGATHHALEDYGALMCLPGMRAYLPAFDGDMGPIADRLFASSGPAYLRLGLAEPPKDLPEPAYAPWRRLMDGPGWVVLVAGPLAGGIWDALRRLDPERRPSLWLLGELPIGPFPAAFLDDLARSGRLLVVEEHVAQGGVAQMVASELAAIGRTPARFAARNALGYPSGLYGSQRFHRAECGLDAAAIFRFLDAEDS